MWPNPQFPTDLVIFTEEILNEKLHFLCSEHGSGVSIIDTEQINAGWVIVKQMIFWSD